MRENLTQILARYRRAFGEFTNGQKAVAVVGTAALLLAAFLVFRWVAAPSYSPLYTNLASSDASDVIDELNKEGVKYKLTDGGSTITVPSKQVYSTRIALAGKDLPSGNGNNDGYSLLDNESLSTSDFQEQTDFKRAMEGELDKTLENMTGVDTAVVHLAMPQKQVFSDQQDPTTASVLLQLSSGTTLSDEQVQAVVHIVAASIDGLDPANVTVSDSNGNVLNAPDDGSGTQAASTQAQQTTNFENGVQSKVQQLLDGVVGPGNARSDVTAVLNYDQTQEQSDSYTSNPSASPLEASSSSTQYQGTGPGAGLGNGAGGVVGPDGQMEQDLNGAGSSASLSTSANQESNAVDHRVQSTVVAPGLVESLHVGVVIDSAAISGTPAAGSTPATGPIQPSQIKTLIASTLGINPARGDTIDVSVMPFNHDAQTAAAKELAAAQAADDHAKRIRLYRDLGVGAVVALMILLAWIKSRRRSKAREQATTYVVEQLRADAAARAAQIESASPALEALEALRTEEEARAESVRYELQDFVDDQPEDVAALLRGWLVERGR